MMGMVSKPPPVHPLSRHRLLPNRTYLPIHHSPKRISGLLAPIPWVHHGTPHPLAFRVQPSPTHAFADTRSIGAGT